MRRHGSVKFVLVKINSLFLEFLKSAQHVTCILLPSTMKKISSIQVSENAFLTKCEDWLNLHSGKVDIKWPKSSVRVTNKVLQYFHKFKYDSDCRVNAQTSNEFPLQLNRSIWNRIGNLNVKFQNFYNGIHIFVIMLFMCEVK